MTDLTEEDKNWIKEYIKQVGDVKGFYPRFQYSIFPNGKEEQIVIRCETYTELLQAKRDINPILEKIESKAEVKPKEEVKTQGCPKCGGTRTLREGVSKKNGKRWVGWFCSNPDCPPEFINMASKV